MITTLIYNPDKGILLNNKKIDWGFNRKAVRDLVGGNFLEQNSTIDLSEYNNGDDTHNIIRRRDVYQNYNEQNNYFFFNYDKEDNLKEVEVHDGVTIFVNTVKIDFNTNFGRIVSLLKEVSSHSIAIADGEYFFKDLKLVVADSQAMNGEGDQLAYFYCSKNISHIQNHL